MIRRIAARFVVLAGVTAVTCSCGSAVRNGSSPVYMVIDSLQGIRGAAQPGAPAGFLLSDVLTNVTSPAPCTPEAPCPTIFDDPGTVVLRLAPRDTLNPTAPTTNNEVTITRVHVEYVRADGRNTPGVDVPYAFDGAVTGTVPAAGSATLGFELVRSVAKQEAPLVQLRTSSAVMTCIANVTFYGQDRTGNNVNATGQIQINFANFGDF